MRRAITLTLLLALFSVLVPAGAESGQDAAHYRVSGVHTSDQRTTIADTGAAIDDVGSDSVDVIATPAEHRQIRKLGFRTKSISTAGFRPGDEAYHDYDETVADLQAVAAAHPTTVHLFDIGYSYEGRKLWAARISDDAADNLTEPGVLYVGMHHAREHLTHEIVLYLLHLFAESTDPAITSLVANRQIYLVPILNPDGYVYDIAGSKYRLWRKNRQPAPSGRRIGTDLNRNYGYKWGLKGSSGSPGSSTYRGPAPFSAPEAAAMRTFVDAHANIRASISYHSSGRLILYPYGYTKEDIPLDMDPVDHQAFVSIAQTMASTTGYKPEQGSDLYLTSGDMDDWTYGTYRIFSFTFELGGGFYPPGSWIPTETARNRDAALYLAQVANCPRTVVGATC